MKNIIVGILTVVIFALMIATYMGGPAYHGGTHNKIIKNIGTNTKTANASKIPEEKDDRKKESDKLKALKEKAGNVGAFKVSQKYKSKCASCHGVNGSGFQNGKPMMGPKLFGQSSDVIYKDLIDFKTGKKENLVMKGLLLHLSKEELKEFAEEIGEFPARAKAIEKNK